MSTSNLPLRIAITPGEPAGIGPDLCIALAQQPQPCELIFICDPLLIAQRAQALKIAVNIHEFNSTLPARLHQPGMMNILSTPLQAVPVSGHLNVANSQYVLASIESAAQGCVNQDFDGMVTGPVHKGIINDAGIPFSGHTEFIADITGGQPVMMLATEGLRVALVTTHLPLKQVSQAINVDSLESIIRILQQDFGRYFGLHIPKILVCGLNPHAGEGGHLGREEIEVIEPVIHKLRVEGFDLTGPLPADTLFTPKHLAQADVVLAMYHDQGLPVLKYKGFGNAVNITLGLPIIRTSVDHGTALDLAGTGQADMGSLSYALKTAIEMAHHHKQVA